MPKKTNRSYDSQLKIDAVKYLNDHPESTALKCAENLGISVSNLNRWKSQLAGTKPTEEAFRGSGNYANDAEKEAARLRRENKDLKDALEVLKKAIGILGN